MSCCFGAYIEKREKKLVKQIRAEERSIFAKEIQDKVSLEFEAGGRYPGHLIMPWEDVVRPIINKAALKAERAQEDHHAS